MLQKWYTEEWASPELYGNHLGGDTRVAFHAKNADTIVPSSIVVRGNDKDIAVILIWNIHQMDSDVRHDSGYNYENSRECINIKKLVSNVQNGSLLASLCTFLEKDYTPALFGKGKVKPMQIAIKKKNLRMHLVN